MTAAGVALRRGGSIRLTIPIAALAGLAGALGLRVAAPSAAEQLEPRVRAVEKERAADREAIGTLKEDLREIRDDVKAILRRLPP